MRKINFILLMFWSLLFQNTAFTQTTIIVIGGGLAGSEAGTFLGQNAKSELSIIEIEVEPTRKFGGWGFQAFPDTETTNLAMRKVYLGEDPEDIFTWAREIKELNFNPDKPIPRFLMQKYVKWRRDRVSNELVSYESIIGEAVDINMDHLGVIVTLRDGKVVRGDRVVIASGSISIKIPTFLSHLTEHKNVIIDPLVKDGHERRAKIPQDARVLIVGTGLTGEEQASVLYKSHHTNLTLLSRTGKQHFIYPREQKNQLLTFDAVPKFLDAQTEEEFDKNFNKLINSYTEKGHSPEDIFAAIRASWDQVKQNFGDDNHIMKQLFLFRRTLATNSIGISWKVAKALDALTKAGALAVSQGHIQQIIEQQDGSLEVIYRRSSEDQEEVSKTYDYIINAIGRNIIRHDLWDNLLKTGLVRKDCGIGVEVNDYGQPINANGHASEHLWLVGMARAGDHMLRHGFLGNTAFNVPQLRAHLYTTMRALLQTLEK